MQRITINKIKKKKGKVPITCLSAYSRDIAEILDKYCDIILIGDSVGMVLYGMKTTRDVSFDTMLLHAKTVKKFTKKSGKLLPITFNNKFPIKVKRIFIIYGKKDRIRGDHAHKKCSQVFFPIMGKIKISMKYKKTEKSINLSHKGSNALLVPPRIWSRVEFLKNNSVVLVLTDYEYDFKDYIETYKEFIAFQKRNK